MRDLLVIVVLAATTIALAGCVGGQFDGDRSYDVRETARIVVEEYNAAGVDPFQIIDTPEERIAASAACRVLERHTVEPELAAWCRDLKKALQPAE